jgi:hypothetical protein
MPSRSVVGIGYGGVVSDKEVEIVVPQQEN